MQKISVLSWTKGIDLWVYKIKKNKNLLEYFYIRSVNDPNIVGNFK